MPFRNMTKYEVAKLGIELKAPIGQTFSSQASPEIPCGACPNSVDRLNALKQIEQEKLVIMCKTMTSNALKLKEYINRIDDFKFVEPEYCPYINHIGALFTDTILQAGVNYRSIVWPRVAHILDTFPYATTVSVFAEVLENYGLPMCFIGAMQRRFSA